MQHVVFEILNNDRDKKKENNFKKNSEMFGMAAMNKFPSQLFC